MPLDVDERQRVRHVAMALAIGAADPDTRLQARVEHAVASLRDGSPALAGTFETALTEGLRAAILLRLSRVDGATENGRKVLRALLGPVDIQRSAMAAPARWIMAPKLTSVLS